jgi:hypothetical protein
VTRNEEAKMERRIGLLTGALAAIAIAIPAPAPASAAADRSWCMTYCDTIHVGCKKTLGWLDMEACEEWKKGCLDGCKVND